MSWEQYMSLGRRAHEWAGRKGHKMSKFTVTGKVYCDEAGDTRYVGGSKCSDCGMKAVVETYPWGNRAHIHGPATSIDCPGGDQESLPF